MTEVHTLSDPEAACAFAAAEIAAGVERALAVRGVAHLALAGGTTPRRAYQLLGGLLSDWSAVEVWYGDERCVKPDDPESNHRMVLESLVAAIEAHGATVPEIHRMRGELGPEAAAHEYEVLLRERIAVGDDALPALDVSVLGLGPDGHTASLFPGHRELDEAQRLCLPVYGSPKPPSHRVTLSLPVLRAARTTLLLATGAEKAQALAGVLAGPNPSVPASLLGGDRLHVITDEAAHPTT